MTDRKKILIRSVLIMMGVAVAVGAISLFGSYRAAFEQQRARLLETVHSRARLIEEIARFAAAQSASDVPGDAEAGALAQVVRAHERFRGFGKTGEFALARREGDQIVFLLRHRHFDLDDPRPIPFDSELAEPMRRALSGQSGTVIGPDYRGEKVLAAYEPVDIVNWGMVAKIDLAEIRGVFVRGGVAVAAAALVVVAAGALSFLRGTDPLIKRLEINEARLRAAQRVARMGSWDWNIAGNELYWSDETYRIFGLSPHEFGATYDAFLAAVHPDDREFVQRHVDAAVHDDAEYGIDHRIVLPDGEVRYVHEQGEVTRDAAGAPIRMIGTVADVTERKRLEEERDRLFDVSLDMICVAGFDGYFKRLNPAFERTLGYARGELLARPFVEFVHPEDRAATIAELDKLAGGTTTLYFENRYRCRDGSYRWFAWNAVPDADRGLTYAVARDMTEPKRAEEAVREHARLLDAFFRYSLTAIAFLDRDFNLMRVNEAYARPCQRDVSEFPGHNHFEFYPSDAQKIFEEVRGSKVPFQTFGRPFVFPDHPEWGVTYWDWTLVPILDDAGEVELLVLSLSDVTERKRTEEAHRLNEARLEALVRLNDVAEAPLQQVADFVLEEAVRLTGSAYGFLGFMSDDESVMNIHAWSGDAMERCSLVDRPTAFPIAEAGLWGEAVRQRKPIIVNDYSALENWKRGYPEGHVHISRFLGIPVSEGKRITAVAAVANKEDEYQEGDARQLTLLMGGMWRLIQRQRAEEAVRESRNFLQTVIDEIPESLMVIDRDHRIVLANRALRELAGGKDPVAGCLTCYQASHRRDTPCEESSHPCPVRQVIATKAPVVVTHTHLDAGGRELLQEIVAAPIFDEAGEVVQIIESSRDITARVRAEEQARQRQAELAHVARLGTMGEMAAGLAHELNQPLSAIVNYVQACLERVQSGAGDPDELLDDMDQAAAQAERAGEIIENVRNFVRKGEPRRTRVDFNALVTEAIDLLSYEIRRHAVQLHLDLAHSLPPIMAEPIQIEQVIVNLARNSLEAMSENELGTRKLSIETSVTTDNRVEFAIRDAGPGLPADIIERIFDPFFTTKPDGMGMGLSISRSIIEAHGGRLWAVSSPGRGAAFLFTLPVDDRGSEDDA